MKLKKPIMIATLVLCVTTISLVIRTINTQEMVTQISGLSFNQTHTLILSQEQLNDSFIIKGSLTQINQDPVVQANNVGPVTIKLFNKNKLLQQIQPTIQTPHDPFEFAIVTQQPLKKVTHVEFTFANKVVKIEF